MKKEMLPAEKIQSKIFLIRGQKVMLDQDLADLYGVGTKRLNEQVRRNSNRFPEDFMFQLSNEEFENLRSQSATSSWGGRRYAPYAFTEQGVAMLSSVLNSERAIQVNVQIMRSFIQLRQMLTDNEILRNRLDDLEAKYDKNFQIVFRAIKQLLRYPDDQAKKIGFKPDFK